MILKKFLFLLSFVFAFTVQVLAQRSNDVADKAIESIVGRWELQKVYAGSREITSNPNSENSTWIEFNPDGTYRQQAEETEQGSYRLNENHSVLYLESERRKETSSAVSMHNLTEYNITMRDGMLTMQSRGENTGSTKYVYARAAQSESENK
jgi:phage terminase large subunit GpA-like protein